MDKREAKIIKTYNFLKELHLKTKDKSKFPLGKFTRDMKMDSLVPQIVIEKGLISRTHIKSRVYIYKWSSIEPSRLMAIQLITEVKKQHIKRLENQKEMEYIKSYNQQLLIENESLKKQNKDLKNKLKDDRHEVSLLGFKFKFKK